MKNTVIKLLVVAMASMCLAGCGTDEVTINGNVQSSSSNASDAGSETTSDAGSENLVKGYVFNYLGKDIYIDESMDDVVADLGEAEDCFEAASCAFGETVKYYTYGSIQVATYTMDEKDYVLTITLLDDMVSTPEGVKVGDSPESAVAVYGDSYTDCNGSYSYAKDGMTLNIINEDGNIVSIKYDKVLE